MLDEGAGGMSAIQLASEQDRLGAGIRVAAGVDAAYVSVSTLTKTLDATLELVTQIVTAPTFDAKDFERLQGDRGTSLELRRDRPRELATSCSAPRSRPRLALRPSGRRHARVVPSISLDDLKGFYLTHWNRPR
jgi:predicted Zn-dependent peptidase